MANDLALQEAAAFEPTALLEFFELDATAIGGGVLHLAPYMNGLAQDITWQGIVYSGFPVEFTGHLFTGQGATPRPTVRFANVLGTFSSLCLEFDDLCGAKFTRRRTFFKFLDGQPAADPTAAFPDDIWEIDRKSYEDRNYVEFELASALDVDGVMLPRRQVMAATCPWVYRSTECSFARNVAIAIKDDTRIPGWQFVNNVTPTATVQNFRGDWDGATAYAINDVVARQITPRVKRLYLCSVANTGNQPPNAAFWIEDICSLTLRGCNQRYGSVASRPYGGFPGTQKVQGTS